MDIPPELERIFPCQRDTMVTADIAGRGIRDPLVLEAMRTVERHRFVDPVDWDEAYEDHPLRIACGQTISQPYIVAYMTEHLRVKPGMRVLEIGTGSGYQAAVLATIGAEVYTVERHAALQARAEGVLVACGLAARVHFRVGDGSQGWAAHAPYDRILVTAAAPEIPAMLVEQLAEGGRMILPTGEGGQRLRIVTKEAEGMQVADDLAVMFVPLIGSDGFPETTA